MAAPDLGNLRADSGLEKLNSYMSSRSYISGYQPSQDDSLTAAKLLGPPSACKYPHAFRWYKHVSAFHPEEQASWPKGVMKQETKKQEDDDIDLFGKEDGMAGIADRYESRMQRLTHLCTHAHAVVCVCLAEGDDDDAAEIEKLKAKKKEEAAGKKKKEVINKSSLVIEIKPASAETDLDEIARLAKGIQMEGLTWGEAVKKVPVAFGLYKLQLSCVIIDDKVNTNEITDLIEALGMTEEQKEKLRKRQECEDEEEEGDEDEEADGLVQSAEIVSFNKL
ncbi:hypothetical protein Emag_004383 [Eimeria magna]